MMQGDSYGLLIEIRDGAGDLVTPEAVSDVEITIGFQKKRYAAGEILYVTGGKWAYPLTQEETFRFPAMRVKGQVRVAFQGGYVEGASLGYVNVNESNSKEVL